MTHERDGERLVRLARDTIAHELGGPPPVRPVGAWFELPAATFVTITRDGALHGCVGTLEPRRRLDDDVQHNALAAAFRDPRSAPFRPEWLAEMGVEVSLLSPLERMDFTDEADAREQLVPGEDGVVLRYAFARGTFLPQVWATLPDPRDFLAELKRKAGLPRSFWAEGVELDRFRVERWGDAHRARTGAPPRPRAA
jgi:AmmeMemoRadiSam system protein A